MKKLLSTILLAVIVGAVQAKTYRIIKAPEVTGCVNISQGELKVREVIMRDTATTVLFTMEYPKGMNFVLAKNGYLMDEEGNQYFLHSAEGVALDVGILSPENGQTDFTMHFDPMPKKVQVFDFIEGDVSGAFMALGIHDKNAKMPAPKGNAIYEELVKTYPYALPEDWFKTDSVTVRGRIEDYDPEQSGFTQMTLFDWDISMRHPERKVINITPNGSFEKTFMVNYPRLLTIQNAKINIDELIPYYAIPNDVNDITVKKNEQGEYEYFYNNGSSKDVERWLKLTYMFYPFSLSNGNVAQANILTERLWQNMMLRLRTAIRHNQFTPLEVNLALCNAQVNIAFSFLDYIMIHKFDVVKQEERDGRRYTVILDSAEWAAINEPKSYPILQRINFDNPMLMAAGNYPILVNRIQYADYVRSRQIPMNAQLNVSVKDANDFLMNGYAAMRELMGTDHDNLMAQICTYQNMLNFFDSWREYEGYLSDIIPLYQASFTHPYVRLKAEQFYADKMAQQAFSSPLPDTPAAQLIRSLSERYPGRMLFIDFWGTGCGPCRAAIQDSKNLRAEIAKRDDVKLIFIAGERTEEGSNAYKKYVDEWLADEETICLTNEEFARMQELFGFSGIPFYVTITPDCHLVRDDLKIRSYNSFNEDIQRLKEKLK